MLQTLIKVGIAQNRDWIINYLTKALLGAELLTAKEVENSMKVSRSTLYRWEKKGLITPMRYGRSKRYCKDELLKLKNMVDNITLKCCDKEVYHHLCYGTFVEESNWISGKPYDRLLLNNGKSGTDRENLKIEFERDSMTISGSIRKWYYGASSLDDLTKTDLEKAWRKVAAWLGISFDTLRTFEISEIEIGLNVPINMTCTEMVHRIWGFTSKRYKLKESSSECREFVLACHTVKICNGIDEINGNVLIRRNILRVAFLSGDGRRSVLDRLKAGTLGELFDGYYIRAVNYFGGVAESFF